ncbi:hypothetical protein BH695_1876 [Microcystis aeruginosa PCC 7806SL]|uniref:Uncharacterized protein n=1 Tax=Microcystis aeruginosa PCC 7806SL TaxID=1903187 RepID=A0AB33BKI2_MICA7|nr:hypothetical protein BH695_1876 [Microcystis aeruginosa PCC 7806SL]
MVRIQDSVFGRLFLFILSISPFPHSPHSPTSPLPHFPLPHFPLPFQISNALASPG